MFVDAETSCQSISVHGLFYSLLGLKRLSPFCTTGFKIRIQKPLSWYGVSVCIYHEARYLCSVPRLCWDRILIYVSVIMTLFPIVFAVIENDLRKVLVLTQQPIRIHGDWCGIGTQLALNGAATHLHILYKLLFMAMGAVLYRTGTIKLGGLYKSSYHMHLLHCGLSFDFRLSLFSGFVTKSMTMTAAFQLNETWLWTVDCVCGCCGPSGIKIPFFAFFAHDSGKRVKKRP